ncbi:hypothetical protein BDV59DRAFT_175676 [Aspergillus ambiguus]|uniref:uncharacterized protein n=1 Tax=Aspergillus ambiguus TaxID=176160 RepID=UPI003CCE2D20
MDYRSDRAPVHPAASSSHTHPSSLPHRRWSQVSSVTDTSGPSHAHGRCESTTIDDTTRAYRTTATRQLNGTPRPLSPWKNRHTQPSSGRSSTLASQPVLVRSYSGGPDGPPETSSKMPLRRSFPFVGGSSSILTGRSAQRSGPELPSEQEFSIDGILRAIEPDIRSTLDSIGEICGRSKLSLANEYGSHIAPLGEIRAPPGGLGQVEEASPDHERQTDNVVIYDDEQSVADGREYVSFPLYGYVEQVRQAGGPVHNAGYQSMLAFSGGDGVSAQAQPDTPRSMVFNQTSDPSSSLAPPAATREFASKPRSSGRALLGSKSPSCADDPAQDISTPAVVSEMLLDAQAGGHPDASASSYAPLPPGVSNLSHDAPRNPCVGTSCRADATVLADVQALFGWLRNATQDSEGSRSEDTAEMRLRAMLQREAQRADPRA